MNNRVRAVVFDYSGVMFNDRLFALSVVNNVFRRFSIPPIDLAQFQREFKLPFYLIFTERGIPREVAEEAAIRAYHWKYPKYRDDIWPFDDAVSFIRTLKSQGMGFAIVSQTPRAEVVDQLERFGLLSYFDSIIAYREARAEKPDPAPLLETVARLGLKPEEIAYFGDMKEDIECAERAGVCSFAVARPSGSYHTTQMLLDAYPDYIVSDLSGLETQVLSRIEVMA